MLKILVAIFLVLPSIVCADTIHYKISKMGISATASLSFKGPVEYKGRTLALIEFKAKGFNFFDEEMIYVDLEHSRPQFVERNLNIFGSKEKISEEYLLDKIIITKTVGTKISTQVIEVNKPVDNIYGFIDRQRKKETFELGKDLEINLPTKNLKIKLTKNVTMKAMGRTFEAFYMQSDPAQYQILFDTSSKHIPLRITDTAGFGNTTMVMTSYEED